MSVLSHTADLKRAARDVREVPFQNNALQQKAISLVSKIDASIDFGLVTRR
jgi:hypothetical protein